RPATRTLPRGPVGDGVPLPSSSVCSDGRICPANTRCDVVHHLCVGIENTQEVACVGLAEGGDCTLAGAKGKCHGGLCELLTCGDGVLTDPESCDGSDLGGKTCAGLGYYAQTTELKCISECTFDTSGCVGLCGDTMTSGPEQCDGSPPQGETGLDNGYDRGLLACSAVCSPFLNGCGEIGWNSVPSQQKRVFAGVWGNGRDDIFAVGTAG